MVKYCPLMLNAFKLSGEYDVSIFLVSSDIRQIYDVVNTHFRANSEVQKVSMDLVTNISQDFILPLDLDIEGQTPSLESRYGANCEYCKNHKMI